MAAGLIFIQWDNYVGGATGPPFFSEDPLTFSSRQERLHRLAVGDRLWLLSRCPEDGQYYFVAVLAVQELTRNPPGGERAALFGEYAVLAARSQCHDLGRRFPAEALLRAFLFETGRPIKYGSNIGQSLQTLRLLDAGDERVLNAAFEALQQGESPPQVRPCGLWTKCHRIFADYFLKNWSRRHEPLAFLLYDSPPSLRSGSPVFIHADEGLRLVARFRGGQFVAGHKRTVVAEERIAERRRVWETHRVRTTDPPTEEEFEKFWDSQNGVRGLFLMDEVVALPKPVTFKVYGAALEWGFPMGVGYRYLSLQQSLLLLRSAALPSEADDRYLRAILDAGKS